MIRSILRSFWFRAALTSPTSSLGFERFTGMLVAYFRGSPRPVSPGLTGACNTDQVQIRRFDAPALWRCQMCELWFEHEPDDHRQNEKSYTVVYKDDRWIEEVEEPWRCGPTKNYWAAYGAAKRAKQEKFGRLDWKRVFEMIREIDQS
jgi:hypothetical protein